MDYMDLMTKIQRVHLECNENLCVLKNNVEKEVAILQMKIRTLDEMIAQVDAAIAKIQSDEHENNPGCGAW